MIPGRRAWLWAATAWGALFLLSRVAGGISGLILEPHDIVTPEGFSPPETSGVGSAILGNWLRADALWYLKIADQGYGDFGTYAFFPAFPIAARLLGFVTGGSHIAALILANAACLAGFAVLYSLFERLFDTRAAIAGLLGLALFPTAFFLTSPYAEPFLLLFGAAALLAAADRRWTAAAILGALAALSRPFGFLICIPLAVLGRREPRRGWPPVVTPIVAVAAWGLWVGLDTGDLANALRVQSIWQRELEWPPTTILAAFSQFFVVRGSSLGPYYIADVIALLAGLGLIAGVLLSSRSERLPPTSKSLAIYGAAVLLIPLSIPFPPRPLLSLPRFVLALFPLFAAYRMLPRTTLVSLLSISAAGLGWAAANFVAARPIF